MIFDTQFQMVILGEIKGISEYNYGFLEITLLLSAFILELPSGFLTDYLGYKKTLILSRIFILFYSIIMLVSENYGCLILAFIGYGISEALVSGTEETYIYNFEKNNNILIKFNSILYTVGSVFSLITIFISGILMEYDWKYIYILSIMSQVLSLFLLTKLDKEKYHKEKAKIRIKETYHLAKTNIQTFY